MVLPLLAQHLALYISVIDLQLPILAQYLNQDVLFPGWPAPPDGRDIHLLVLDFLQQDVVLLAGLQQLVLDLQLTLLARHLLQQVVALLACLHHLGGRELYLLVVPGMQLLDGETAPSLPSGYCNTFGTITISRDT